MKINESCNHIYAYSYRWNGNSEEVADEADNKTEDEQDEKIVEAGLPGRYKCAVFPAVYARKQKEQAFESQVDEHYAQGCEASEHHGDVVEEADVEQFRPVCEQGAERKDDKKGEIPRLGLLQASFDVPVASPVGHAVGQRRCQ